MNCSQRHIHIDDFHHVDMLILSSHDGAANLVLHWGAVTGSYTTEGTRGGKSWGVIQVGSILTPESARKSRKHQKTRGKELGCNSGWEQHPCPRKCQVVGPG